jgi:hypothetical protein
MMREGGYDDASGNMSMSDSRTRARRRAFRWDAVVILCAMLGISARANLQQPAAPALPDVQKLGPQVGSSVPEFTLLDQNGRWRTLMSVMGPKGLMLVFFRSADW